MPKRANGEGSIYRASDGRWVGALTLNGKRKVFYGKTRQEANAKMTAAPASVHRGLPLVPERETVKSYLERWLADVVKPGVRPSTYASYEAITRVHLIPSLGKIPLAKLTPQHVQAMLNEKQGRSARRTVHASAGHRCPPGRTVGSALAGR